MKGSKFFIIGSLVVVGVIVYKMCKHFYSIKDSRKVNIHNYKDNSCSKKDMSSPTVSSTDIYDTKEEVVGSVKERHFEAAKAVEESLSTIFNEIEEKTIVTENSESLDKASNDLNDLLK